MLTPERQIARMSEIKNGRLGPYGAEHSKCNRLITRDSKAFTRDSLYRVSFLRLISFLLVAVGGCEFHCSQLPWKTHLQNDLLVGLHRISYPAPAKFSYPAYGRWI